MTLDNLQGIFATAYGAHKAANWYASDAACDRAGLAAVVRAMRPEFVQMVREGLGGNDPDWCADFIIHQILGGANGTMSARDMILNAIGKFLNKINYPTDPIIGDVPMTDFIIADLADAGISLVEWQPISTAPMDGTPVDLWGATRPRYANSRITDCCFMKSKWVHHREIYDEETLDDMAEVYNVTHWMPLPTPPKVKP